MEATLSFLGFGDLYYPTWGVMINFAWKKGALLVGAYQYALVPCICIMLVSLAFYFIALFVEGKQNTING
jgi:ABC-type dipeptide/oligopeptide/nickel transport system permease subunit